MITPENGAQFIDGRFWRPLTLWGLSSDNKPTENTANGTAFVEMDTSVLYFFDAENGQWREWGGGS